MGVRSKDTNRDSQTKRGIRSHFFLSRKKRLYARAIEVGIHLSLLSNLFWILKTTLVVGYRLLWFFIISFEGFLGSFRLYIFSLFWLLLSTFLREMVKDLRR